MRDVNALVVAGPPLVLLTAFGINDRGQIVGLAFNLEDFQPHAYLATPIPGAAPPASATRVQMPRSLGGRALGTSLSRSGVSSRSLRFGR